MRIADGLIKFLIALCNGSHICLDHVVQKIEYDGGRVNVKCLTSGTREVVFSADCVLCTVPLGVLKRSVRNRNNAPLFHPELPRWKVDAINSLGFGNVNKIMLFFEKPFWENTRVFGQISDTMLVILITEVMDWCATSRGEMFMFQAHRDKPILIALVSGDSANALEEAPADAIVYQIMNFLSSVFGPACPKEPTDVIITRWRADCFSCGAFSYVPPNCLLDAYDNLAAPVKDSTGCNRIFFAGEHTCQEHPGTIHGAYLSGLREAGRIADLLLGIPYGAEIDPKRTTASSEEV
uniref:Amino_oxidase domain-containing protein n=1 Tax=Elaeophora elaphi TaxID=1147741 RepID=A0A0R3RSK8_9BILA